MSCPPFTQQVQLEAVGKLHEVYEEGIVFADLKLVCISPA